MSSTKCMGLIYPTHFLKSKGSVLRNNFLEYCMYICHVFYGGPHGRMVNVFTL